jgi:multidrug efflux pump subunit AcrA (membrane-fusion protein)
MPETEAVEREVHHSVPRWIIAVIIVFAFIITALGFTQYRTSQELAAFRQDTSSHLQTLAETSSNLESEVTDLQGDMQATTEKLGLTEKQLTQARATARRLREEQQKAAEQFSAQLQEQQSQLAEVSGDVAEVQSEVAETQGTLSETRSRLEGVVGDLGVQSGLVARNREELAELRRRGERDYFEFDLARSKEYSRVGAVSVRVNRVDPKRNKYTVTLLVNDRVIEKKDKTLLEPVQFYLPDSRHLLEIVVFEMQKNRIGGYLSAPKELAMRNPAPTP